MTTDAEPTRVVIPVVQETVEIEKHARPTGVVHVHRRVHEEVEEIDEPLESTEVVVERVPVGAWIDKAPAERREGDTMIIPVVEEVPVVVMRLRLVEEVHVTRRRTTRRYRDRVPVRRSEVTVEREEAEQSAPPPPTPEYPTPEHRRSRMTMTVIGLFQTPEPARRASQELTKAGCPEESVRLFDKPRDDLASALAEFGIDAEDARAFSGAIAKGAAVIAVEVEDDQADEIRSRLERNDARAVDVYEDERHEQGGKSAHGERKVLPEVEEQVRIGKRRVVRGVHASTHVTERPVEKTLTLEEEKVRVRHREADRELSPEEAERAFKETSVDMTETTEEAEVRKAARLIGEVELTKSTTEHKETVRETARKTEVDVERTGGRGSKK
ncbi:YsnF/AvaK domain-containing protein [Azospirillum canadense]|uniref:YsnF/AvaK domain-containing protein n=1 Tax=Azospirillum canadense TaxID=403962 RepID=UPI00222701E8|nr:YsnF/AvaK domain-containing protein [Azospirillum canadense]MCW2237531.1 stress response protein YsnF [Azospirillum canadense]